MDYKISNYDGKEYFEIECPNCYILDVAEVIRHGESGIHCIYCNEHLGYIHDIPEKYRKYIKKL